MNSKMLACLFVALQCSSLLVAAGRPFDGRSLLDTAALATSANSASSNTQDGSASASSGVNVFAQGGTIFGSANAVATAEAEAEDAIATAVSTAFAENPDGPIADAQAEAFAKAAAEAVARAYSLASVTIISDAAVSGGCGGASSTAQAQARAFAVAFTEAVAVAKNVFGTAAGDILTGAIAEAIAKAESTARAEACKFGSGLVNSTQQAATEAYIKVFAVAFSYVFAAADGPELIALVDGFAGAVIEFELVNASAGGSTTVIGAGFADGSSAAGGFTGLSG